ncbi:DUF2145 domain-containing protein [Hydrogenophaga sp. 5NK40-0174]
MVAGLEQAALTRQSLEREHAASGATVVLLARAGQDLSEYGLNYSHVAWAYRAQLPSGISTWHVVHKLNHCGSDKASVYRQGLGEFFLDNLWQYRAAYVVPDSHWQTALYRTLTDDREAVRLHHERYSVVSYPWSTRYQQSNQWAIETLSMAVEPGVTDRNSAQAWLRFKGYKPTVLRISALKRLGGRIGSANVAFDDHPGRQRWSSRIATTTADSIFVWMQSAGYGSKPVLVLPGA